MASTQSILRAELLEAIGLLETAQNRLADTLLKQINYPLSIQGESAEQMRPSVANFVKLLEYANDNMEPGDTVNHVGLIGTDQSTLKMVGEVNAARKSVQLVLKRMDKFRESSDSGQIYLSKKALADMGYSRFNRRQASRQFVTFPHSLDSVSFTWARSKVVSEISIKRAKELLDIRYNDNQDPIAQEAWHAQKLLLESLPPNEPLVQVAPPVVHPRANVTYKKDEKRARTIKVAISPIFFLSRENGPLPRIKPLGDKDIVAERLKRSDVQVQEESFIGSIRVHRYFPEFVDEKIKKRKKQDLH